jgi:lactoylglutathione lyase
MYDPSFDFGILNMEGGSIGFASNHSGELMMPGKFPASKNGQPDGVEIAFYSSDVALDYRTAIEAGAESLAAPRKMEWGQTEAYVKSIEGTIIGICSEIPER